MKKQNTTCRLQRPANRRGITLLFVISMIVLFLLMGTTFVIVSNNYLRDARRRGRMNIQRDSGTVLLDRAIFDLIRGPSLTNTTSSLRGHDFLSDQYGYGIKAYVDGDPNNAADPDNPVVTLGSNGQLISIKIRSRSAPDQGIDLLQEFPGALNSVPLSTVPDFYNGSVLSFTSGEAIGASCRVVDYFFDTTDARYVFVIMPEWAGQNVLGNYTGNDDVFSAGNLYELARSEIIINGRPFSGFGAGGYAGTARNLAALGATALSPNRVGYTHGEITGDYLAQSNSVNESYDACDYQNMFLSGRDATGVRIPSFHRDSLLTYHEANVPVPVGDEHLFSVFGVVDTNPVSPTYGQTTVTPQVDADGDGTPESIFIDTGLPIQSDPSGRKFKPLVAYHVVDLDGKLNLNAHGNLADVRPNKYIQNGNLFHNGGIAVSVGQGYGPPEISLSGLFGTGPLSIYNYLLVGNPAYEGRYGDNSANLPGSDIRDPWARHKLFGYPEGFASLSGGNYGTIGRLFATSPMDLHGRLSIAVPDNSLYADPNFPAFRNGLPVIDMVDSDPLLTDEALNSPYEFNYSTTSFSLGSGYTIETDGRLDQPFSATELERVLRPFDRDVRMLPQRLWDLGGTIWTTTPDVRDMVSTESYEVPVAPIEFYRLLVAKFRAANPAYAALTNEQVLADVLTRADVRQNSFQLPPLPVGSTVGGMFAPELFAGLKMDVNRAFGDGHDNNGNGVVDELFEDLTGAAVGEVGQTNTDQLSTPVMDLNNGGDGTTNDELAKYYFAKQLYCLMSLVSNDNVGATASERIAHKTRIAQWAINVVDFRDPDSIMTPFEFDLNPWDGWQVDGRLTTTDATTDRAIVWGCERPELLLSENIAVHDRRTEDEATAGGGRYDNGTGTDDDFDQRLVPNSGAWIEIYNPWTKNRLNQIIPAELSATGSGVSLQKLTPNGDPVWRVGIKRPADTNFDRALYFSNADPVNVTDIPVKFFPSNGSNIPELPPGQHATFGPPGQEVVTVGGVDGYRFAFGRLAAVTRADETIDLMLDRTRNITLFPDNNITNNVIRRYGTDGAGVTGNLTDRSNIAVIVDTASTPVNGVHSRGFSVTDPPEDYPKDMMGNYTDALGNPAIPIEDGFAFTSPHDRPLDATLRGRQNSDLEAIWTNGHTDNYRVLHLQRLANPLLPWDANLNPYISIDCSPMDLVAYNGVQNDTNNDNQNGMGQIDPGPVDPGLVTIDGAADTWFGSLERGESQIAAGEQRLLFKSDDGNGNIPTNPADPADTTVVGDGHRLSFRFRESFGRTNDEYITPSAGGNSAYAWLSWNNRPYVSHLELANVPYSAPDRLTFDFSTDLNPADPYDTVGFGDEYGHLLNFYGTEETAGGPDRSNFHLVMDYLEVPSRFAGTETTLDPATFTNNPFNYIPRYRYPGKINLNTIYHEEVWDALMGGYGGVAPGQLSFADFQNSRNPMLAANMPTDFSNPYRFGHEGNWVPVTESVTPNELVLDNGATGMFRRNAAGQPLFAYEPPAEQDALDTTRNAYFRNDIRQRLGNLTTIRSSVFAVWVTIGYFEVDNNGLVRGSLAQGRFNNPPHPLTGAAVPSGLPIELGSDTGDVKRDRAFFIFDRSIPVAFEPGKNHNVERAILTKSYIE